MNHDITHCYGCSTVVEDRRIKTADDICPKRDTCYRYLAHLEVVKFGLTYVCYHLGSINNCSEYWSVEGGEE